jgi:hypothetical protein
MAREKIELTDRQQRQAEQAFHRGDSNNRICSLLGVSQRVWERALRERLGDEAFDAQMEANIAANRGGGRRPAGQVPSSELRPDIRQKMDLLKKRDLQSRLARRKEEKAKALAAAEAREALKAARVKIRQSGETIPVVCSTSGEAYRSITAAAKATGVEMFRVRRSVLLGIEVRDADGRLLRFRRWQEGDPEVEVIKVRKAIPLRFEDGSCWHSGQALITAMGATPAEGARFYRRLKKLGYGPDSPPLALRELLILANWLPQLERKRLADRIEAAEGCRVAG